MIDEETKQEGYARIRASRAKRQQMKGISPTDLSQRFRIHFDSIVAIRDGRDVSKPHLTQHDIEYIREAARTHKALSEAYESLDQIALALGVSRRCINRWSKQIGMSATRTRNVGQSVQDFIDEPNAGVVEFLTMKLPCSVSGETGYY